MVTVSSRKGRPKDSGAVIHSPYDHHYRNNHPWAAKFSSTVSAWSLAIQAGVRGERHLLPCQSACCISLSAGPPPAHHTRLACTLTPMLSAVKLLAILYLRSPWKPNLFTCQAETVPVPDVSLIPNYLMWIWQCLYLWGPPDSQCNITIIVSQGNTASVPLTLWQSTWCHSHAESDVPLTTR